MAELKSTDKLSPQAMLLAAILAEPSLIQEADIFSMPPEAFEGDKAIFDAIVHIAGTGGTPSAVTVTAFFRANGWANGVTERRLTTLAENPPYNETPNELVQLTIDQYQRKRLHSQLISLAREVNSTASLTSVLSKLDEIAAVDLALQKPTNLAELVEKAKRHRLTDQSGVNFNFPGISKLHPLFRFGTLVVVAARTKVGKTNMIQFLVHSVAVEQQIPVLWCPLEPRDVPALDSLGMYMASLDKSKWNKELTSLQREEYIKKMDTLKELKQFYVSEEKDLHAIAAMVRKLGIKVVFIDQLSHINFKSGEDLRALHFEKIAGFIVDEFCKRGVLVVLGVQLLTKNGNHMPTLADIQDSGRIAQFLDQLILLHAPNDRDHPDRIVDLHLNREGKAGKFSLTFNGAKGDFTDAQPL